MKPTLLQAPIKVWYKALPLLPKIPWPIVDIKLSHNKIKLPQPVLALVDSGASISILHPSVAEALGFNLKKLGLPSVGTSVSNKYNFWELPKPIEVDIYGHLLSFKFGVIDNPNLIWPCILGEDSIFQAARLDFQRFKGYFEIKFRQDIH